MKSINKLNSSSNCNPMFKIIKFVKQQIYNKLIIYALNLNRFKKISIPKYYNMNRRSYSNRNRWNKKSKMHILKNNS